jgi:GTP cyclohydrolase FolE2
MGVDTMKNNSVKLSLKTCIECKAREARYWGSHFCEDCFRELLTEKLDEDKFRQIEIENENNKWF